MMSDETKWTKGPWHYTQHGCVKGGEFQKYERGEAQQQVALATARDDGKQEANARLIAAAPELYEALEWAMLFVEQVRAESPAPKGGGEDIAYREALSALAKARGETS